MLIVLKAKGYKVRLKGFVMVRLEGSLDIHFRPVHVQIQKNDVQQTVSSKIV